MANSESGFRDTIVEGNKAWSKKIDSFAAEVDSMLSNRKSKRKLKNKSQVSLVHFVQSREGGTIDQTPHIAVNLRLPQLEEQWKLKFSSYDEEDEFEGLQRNRSGAAPAENKAGTSLGVASKFMDIDTLFRPRLEFQDPLVTSFLLKFNSRLPWKFMVLNWQAKFFTHSIDGVGQSFSLDFEKPLTDSLLLRFFNEQQYLDRDNVLNVSQGPSLLYKLNDLIAFAQTISFNSSNRNVVANELPEAYNTDAYHLQSYQFIFSFSHKLLKNVFHYSVNPDLLFIKERNFKGQAGLSLRLEIIF